MADNISAKTQIQDETSQKDHTGRNGACDIALQYLLNHGNYTFFEVLMVFRMVAFRGGHWGVKNV
jgi:hypothetical protein